jgi:tRNA pseudouridine38-40 synthase
VQRRLRLTIEYDGAGFGGWQIQPNARSIQAELEQALGEVTQEQRRVIGAGRTDAGVHALGQAAHVDVATRMGPVELRKAMNAVLPADVAIRRVQEVPAGFHARRDALWKRYAYRILMSGVRSPLRRGHVWHLYRTLDVERMREAAGVLLGTHDFSAFRGAPGGPVPSETTVRSLDRLDLLEIDDELWIVARGRSFLRYMVRNIVGTLVEIGQGRRDAGDMAEILASRERTRAGATAPPWGLCLEHIAYPGDPDEPETRRA